MDKDLQIALIKNLIIKTKIVLVFFSVVLVLQVIGAIFLSFNSNILDIPLSQFILMPLFIGVILFDEAMILRYLKKCLSGEKQFKDRFKVIITVLELLYPTLLLYFGSVVLDEVPTDMSTFMFLNSPPMVVYFILIALTAFFFEFRISLMAGIIATIGYLFVNNMILDTGIELWINVSKAPFMLATGIITGFVGKKLKESVVSSLESKNILINELDQKVAERTEQIETQKEEIALQYDLLSEKNKEITDSIVYAERIQRAILPPSELVQENLPQSFVLYKPKDIVAGDFYWMETQENRILFAAADCTGHGVPGAMVSVICNNGLNRSVREFKLTDPGLILDKTRELVIKEFEKSTEEVKDGMDIALCSLEGTTVKFAGAHNPLWIIRKGSTEVEEIKADKQPIGHYSESKPFTSHEIQLNKGDTFYTFSDGYYDQFGGERGKKFKTKNFKALLLSIQNENMDQQKNLVDKAFEDWKGNLEQLDDVCVIGVRV